MNESRNFNNEGNNKSNNNGGKMIMTNSSIMEMEVFAGTVKVFMEEIFGTGYRIEIQDVIKNNDHHLTGLSILKTGNNLTPTIYLEGYFEEYRKGVKTMKQVCSEIIRNYEENRGEIDFNVATIKDFEKIKDKICYKLVNYKKNQKMLSDVPHIKFHDLSIIFYILVTKDAMGTGTITIRNNIMDMWGIDIDALHSHALDNTQKLFKGKVSSMTSMISEIMLDNFDDEYLNEFFDIPASNVDVIPMYVATNDSRLNGAGVILYNNLLKEFAERIRSDFFILPSSIHEVLFVPDFKGANVSDLVAMVRDVNATQVADDEVLSDHVYRYNRVTDLVEMI